jgi:hypothetical protein
MSFLPAKVQVNLSLLTSPRIDLQLDAQRQFFMKKNFKIHVPRVMVGAGKTCAAATKP